MHKRPVLRAASQPSRATVYCIIARQTLVPLPHSCSTAAGGRPHSTRVDSYSHSSIYCCAVLTLLTTVATRGHQAAGLLTSRITSSCMTHLSLTLSENAPKWTRPFHCCIGLVLQSTKWVVTSYFQTQTCMKTEIWKTTRSLLTILTYYLLSSTEKLPLIN